MTPFAILCITGFLAIFSSTISKSPALPLFAQHLGAGPAGIGMVAALSAFTGIVASVPAGMLSDRWGRKRMLMIASVVFASAPFLYLFITNIWQLALVRFYHGFATALFIPVSMALISDLFQKERGEHMGWFSAATLLGRFLAPAAGGALLGAFATAPVLGFRTVYLVCGLGGAAAFFYALRIPPDSRVFGHHRPWHETFVAFRSVLANRSIMATAFVEAAVLFAYGTFETFLPVYAHEQQISAYGIGIFLSSQVVVLALTKPLMGKFSDRHGRRPQIIVGAMLGGCAVAGLALFATFLPLLVISILFGFSLAVVTSATAAYIADLSKRETYGSAMGVLGSVMDIGHTTGPVISGVTAMHFGYPKAFLSASLVLGISALIFSLSARRKN